MIVTECQICKTIVLQETDDFNVIIKNYYRNKNDDFICVDCYNSFGLSQGKDQHA